MTLARVRADVRRWGVPRALYALLMEALRRWVGLHLMVVIWRRATPETMPITLPPGIDVRLATRDELLAACQDPALDLTRDFVELALDKGDFCVAAFAGDRIVAYTWRAFSPTQHSPGLWVAFEKPGERYGYKSLTRPEYRGQHLLTAVALFADPLVVARGYPEAISFVESDNFPSLHANLRHGNRRIGYAGFFHLRGRYYPFRSPGAKRYGFRFVPHD
jgi:hypothetical protein